jgi:sugar/nucleoside kinase (ribokinase family)
VSDPPNVVCLGILVADVIARPVERVPAGGTLELVQEITLRAGGCALNTGTALARFGLRVAVAGKVGADAFGDFLLAQLAERELDASGVLCDESVPTATTVVLVDGRGERTFLHSPGADGTVRTEELDEDLLFAGRALHLAGALVLPQMDGKPSAGLLAAARERGVLTSLDTVWDASGRWERILPSLPHLDLFMAGLGEAQAISGHDEPAAAAAWLRARGVREVAVKLGEDGCYVAGEDVEKRLPAPSVRAVDGTGAGDAFAAGLLYGRLAGWPLERAARLGNAAGALATTAVGATEGVPGLHETLALAGLNLR